MAGPVDRSDHREVAANTAGPKLLAKATAVQTTLGTGVAGAMEYPKDKLS
jgi:hypothetical protein